MTTRGKWRLEVSVNIKGENMVGDSVDMDRTIRVPFYAADAVNAERRAMDLVKDFKVAAKRIDREYFKRYCDSIESEDGLSFGEALLIKELDVDIPEIIGGP